MFMCASGEQYRFVMPGAALTEEEFRLLEEKVLAIETGSLLVVSGSLPPGISVDNLTQLVKSAQRHGFAASLIVRARRWPPRLMSAILSWSSLTRKS
jgi:fructose-1-phosphate kinase PfkB-like protein